MRTLILLVLTVIMSIFPSLLFAEVFLIEGGSRIEAVRISENTTSITVSNAHWPALTIPKTSLAPVTTARQQGQVIWNNFLRLGTALFTGNSDVVSLSAALGINRNALWVDEWDGRIEWDETHEAGSLSLRRIRFSLRYGFSLSQSFYGYLHTEALHDFGSELDLRLQPLAGFGYWVSDSPAFKLMMEAGAGWRRDDMLNDLRSDAIMHLRGLVLFTLTPTLHFENSLRWMPALSDFDHFVLENQAMLKLTIHSGISLVLEYGLTVNQPVESGIERLDQALKTRIEWNL